MPLYGIHLFIWIRTSRRDINDSGPRGFRQLPMKKNGWKKIKTFVVTFLVEKTRNIIFFPLPDINFLLVGCRLTNNFRPKRSPPRLQNVPRCGLNVPHHGPIEYNTTSKIKHINFGQMKIMRVFNIERAIVLSIILLFFF